MRFFAVFSLSAQWLPTAGLLLSASFLPPTLAQPAPALPSLGASVNSVETDYTLGAGDRLRIDILQVEEFSGEYLVLVDGTISLPLVGRIQAEGQTIPQVSTAVSQAYTQYLKRPVVTVSLLSPRPLKLAISGEVNRPGSYTVDLNETGKFPSVTDLIRQAGGLRATANIRSVQVRRFLEGREQVLNVNLWELLEQGNLAQDVTLRDGDTVIIPTQDRIDVAETFQLADASFGIATNQPVNVAVVGEVNRPGSYQVTPQQITRDTGQSVPLPPRLTQAVAQAGGIEPLADVRNVEVRRLTRSGAVQTIEVNLWELLQSGNTYEDVILQEGDTIVIPTATDLDPEEAESLASASFAPETIQVNVVGEVENPGVVQVDPNTPLNQALLAAGGFDEQRADESEVELIRLNPNGTVSKREVNIDLSAGINEETNPTLRNNDVVVVERSGFTQATDVLGNVLRPVVNAFTLFQLFGVDF
ncbi:MAG: SLBB domain-containing protein [Cyanophyceae cyanobacterium]